MRYTTLTLSIYLLLYSACDLCGVFVHLRGDCRELNLLRSISRRRDESVLRRAVRNVPQLHDKRHARLDVLAPRKVDTAQRLEQGGLAVALVADNHDARRVDLAL